MSIPESAIPERQKATEQAWYTGYIKQALVPQFENYMAFNRSRYQGLYGLGLTFAGGNNSGKTDISDRMRALVPFESDNPYRQGNLFVYRPGREVYRWLGKIARDAYREDSPSLPPEEWIETWNPYTRPIIRDNIKNPVDKELDTDEIGLWSSLMVNNVETIRICEHLIFEDLSNFSSFRNSLILMDGPRDATFAKKRFEKHHIAPVGTVFFTSNNEATDVDEHISAIRRLREQLDRRIHPHPLMSLDDIQGNAIMLDELLTDQKMRSKLQIAATHNGLTLEQGADGWARPLIEAGFKAASDPNTIIVVQKEKLMDQQELIAWAVRTIVHGMVGATRYDIKDDGEGRFNGFAVPDYLLKPAA